MSEAKKEWTVDFRADNFPVIDAIDKVDWESWLDEVAKVIGLIVIEFNSLQDSITYCIKELMSGSETGDELIYVFLSEMNYRSLATALVRIYGQMIEIVDRETKAAWRDKLKGLESRLHEAATRRNQYVHAAWSPGGKLVRVKTKARNDGVFHTYRLFDTEALDDDLDFIESTHRALEKFNDEMNEYMHC